MIDRLRAQNRSIREAKKRRSRRDAEFHCHDELACVHARSRHCSKECLSRASWLPAPSFPFKNSKLKKERASAVLPLLKTANFGVLLLFEVSFASAGVDLVALGKIMML